MSRHAEEYSDPCIEVTQEEDGRKEKKRKEDGKSEEVERIGQV